MPRTPPLNLIRRTRVDASPVSDIYSTPSRKTQASLDFSPSPAQRRRIPSLDEHPKLAAPQRNISLSVLFLTVIALVYLWYQQVILRAFARLQPSDGRNQLWTDVTTSIKRPRQRHQEVIIIVGSPETGFSPLERNLIQWTRDHTMHDNSYVIPDVAPEIYNATQGNHPLMESIQYKVSGPLRGTPSFSRGAMNKTETLIEEFRSAFNREWMKNKHFVIGSDAFRKISSDTRSRLIDVLISLFPWNDQRYSFNGSNKDVTAIILYRPWSVSYLKSLWAANVAQDNETFSTWIQNYKESYMHEIDQLQIADDFLDKGFQVAILDVDFIVSQKMNLSHYIVCNILKEKCDSHGYLNDAGDDTKGQTNMRDARTEGFDMSEENVQKIKSTLEDGDCLYNYLLEQENVKFYPSKLRRKFEYCDVDPGLGGLEYRWIKLLKELD